MEHECKECGRVLASDEIALFRKLICREATEYACIDCLAAGLSTSPEKLRDLIRFFREKQRCCLFV